jgi:Cu/Ag efflux pump CusA
MMRWLVGSSLRSRRVVIALAALGMVFGFLQLKNMPRDVLPEFVPPTVEVQTEALGLSAAEVEELITVPLEQDLLNGVAFLDTIRSESIPGLSSIEMIFEPGTDILDARQVVAERLTQAHALPQVSKPPQMLQPLSSTNRVMIVGLSSEKLSLIDQSILARWTIRPALLGVEGVANVSVWGSRERQLQVLVDPKRLRANDLTLQQIIGITANAQFVCPLTFEECSTPGTGGIIETPQNRIGLQHLVPYATPGDLAQVAVPGKPGLQLGDVAEVVEDHQVLIGDAASPEGPGLMLVIEKFPGASAEDVTSGVNAQLEALRPGLSEVEMDSSLFSPATYLETSSSNLTTALIIGGVLMLLALGAFMFEWRTALISVISIAASLLGAGLVLSLFDVTVNSMIIAGLVLALVVVVDDAVGTIAGVARRLQNHSEARASTSVARTMLEAFVEMRGAALYGGIISLVAFMPVFFTQGAFGAFVPSIAFAYAVAVVTSMAVALVVSPAVGGVLLSKASLERRESPVTHWLRPRYERGLAWVTGSMRPGIVLVAVLLVAGLAVAPFIGWSLTPEFKDTNLLVHLDGPPGTSLSEMNRVASLVGSELENLPGVRNVGGHTGRALVSDRVLNTNSSELWVSLDPEQDYDLTKASIEEVVAGYPGLDRSVVTYPSERIGEVLTEVEDPITVRVFGQDLELMQSKANEVGQLLTGIDGVENPRVEVQPVEPILEVQVDLEKAEQVGLVPGDVRRAAATLLSGLTVGSLFDEQKVFEVVVWGTPGIRQDLTAIENLSIDRPGGGSVRLADVARVEITDFPTVIEHEAVSRSLDVTAGVSGRNLSDVEAEIEAGLQGIDFPIEYHAEVVEDFAQARAADREAVWFTVAAVIAVFLLMQTGMGSWRLATLVTVMLPLSLVGGAVAVLLTGRVISIGSVVGAIAVMALAARHAVMQVKHVQYAQRREGETFGRDLVVRGARERFSQVLTSAVMSALVFVPLAIAGPIAGLELVQPMAVVILGGLVSATLFNLFIVPALHSRFGSSSDADVSLALEEEERVIDVTEPERAELTRS